MIGHDESTTSRRRIHAQWPADCFYWAELDAELLGRHPTHRQLGFLMEPSLPIAIESVHAVFVRIGPGRFVGCAVERDGIRERLPVDVQTLRPERTPAFLADRVDCRRINLLIGELEPSAMRSLRWCWAVSAIGFLVVSAGLLSFGAQRRVAAWNSASESVERARRDALVTVIGAGTSASDPDRAVAVELSRLKATRQVPAQSGLAGPLGADDASHVLERVFRSWPRDVRLLAESVSVSPDLVTIVGSVPTSDDAQRAADAISRMASHEGNGQTAVRWRLAQPQFESKIDGVNVTLRVRREEQP